MGPGTNWGPGDLNSSPTLEITLYTLTPAYDCAQLQYTIQHRTVLIIFYLYPSDIITAQGLCIREEGNVNKESKTVLRADRQLHTLNILLTHSHNKSLTINTR